VTEHRAAPDLGDLGDLIGARLQIALRHQLQHRIDDQGLALLRAMLAPVGILLRPGRGQPELRRLAEIIHAHSRQLQTGRI